MLRDRNVKVQSSGLQIKPERKLSVWSDSISVAETQNVKVAKSSLRLGFDLHLFLQKEVVLLYWFPPDNHVCLMQSYTRAWSLQPFSLVPCIKRFLWIFWPFDDVVYDRRRNPQILCNFNCHNCWWWTVSDSFCPGLLILIADHWAKL